jgi:hypothetical protein
MPKEPKQLTRGKIKFVFGLCLVVLLYVQFEMTRENEVILKQPVVLAADTVAVDQFDKLVRTNPLAALKEARDRHARGVRDYQCVMVKQEALASGMSTEQEIEVKFRAQPYSVMMNWLRNPGMAQRVIYVKDKWIDESAKNPNERDLAVAQPGVVAQLLFKSIKQPIRGKFAKKSSRRYLDEFGFNRTLDLLIKYCDMATVTNELKLDYKGESHFDGRPVWVIRRQLPYNGEGGKYPDRVAEILIDKEHRVPVAVYCYGSEDKSPSSLLGKYEYRDIRFNTGLTETDFTPATYGM